MMKPKVSPGKGHFLAAVGLLPLSIFTLYKLPPQNHVQLYSTAFPWITLGVSIVLNALIQFVYPRVKNGRVLLLGATEALVALLMLLRFVFPSGLWLLSPVSVFLAGTVGVVFSIMSPQASGGSKLKSVLAFYGISMAVLVLVLSFNDEAVHSLIADRVPVSVRAVAVFVLGGGIALLSAVKIRTDFGFDGAIAGTGALYLFAAYASFSESSAPFLALLLCYLALYLVGATLIHWIIRLNHRAHYDPLLKIYNRGYADSILEQNPQSQPYSVVLFDIDHFKSINDTFGHQAGDAVLFEVAQAIQQILIPDGVLCRYGGEEIIGFLPGKDVGEAVSLAEDCRKTVENLSVDHQGRVIRVTLSGGAAQRQAADALLSDAVAAADACLYKAKENGRNRIVGTRQPSPGGRKAPQVSLKPPSGVKKAAAPAAPSSRKKTRKKKPAQGFSTKSGEQGRKVRKVGNRKAAKPAKKRRGNNAAAASSGSGGSLVGKDWKSG